MEKEFFENEPVETVEESNEKKRKKRDDSERDSHTLKGDPPDIKEFRELFSSYNKPSKEMVPYINELLKMDRAKQTMPGSADVISEIQDYQTKIMSLINCTLQMKESAEARAEEFYRNRLETEKQKNANLEAKIEAQKTEIESLKAEAAEAKEKASEASKNAQNASEALSATKSSLADKNLLVAHLSEQLDSAKMDQLQYQSIEGELTIAKKEAEQLLRKIDEIQREKDNLEEQSMRDFQNAKQTAENEKRAAVLEAKEEAQKKIDSYIEKIEKKDEEIVRLREENAKIQALNEEIARLKHELKEKKISPSKEKDEFFEQVKLDTEA